MRQRTQLPPGSRSASWKHAHLAADRRARSAARQPAALRARRDAAPAVPFQDAHAAASGAEAGERPCSIQRRREAHVRCARPTAASSRRAVAHALDARHLRRASSAWRGRRVRRSAAARRARAVPASRRRRRAAPRAPRRAAVPPRRRRGARSARPSPGAQAGRRGNRRPCAPRATMGARTWGSVHDVERRFRCAAAAANSAYSGAARCALRSPARALAPANLRVARACAAAAACSQGTRVRSTRRRRGARGHAACAQSVLAPRPRRRAAPPPPAFDRRLKRLRRRRARASFSRRSPAIALRRGVVHLDLAARFCAQVSRSFGEKSSICASGGTFTCEYASTPLTRRCTRRSATRSSQSAS